MTNSSNSELTPAQEQAVLDALHAFDYTEMKMREYMDAHANWIKEFNLIWDNDNGDGPMWAEFTRLREDGK